MMSNTSSWTRMLFGTLLGLAFACQPDRKQVGEHPAASPLEKIVIADAAEPNTVVEAIEVAAPEPPSYVWKSNSEYGNLVKKTVQDHFEQDVREMYAVFGIRPVRISTVKFEKGKGTKVSSCEGAFYDFKTDVITFTIGCKDWYTKFVDNLNKYNLTPEQVMEDTRELSRHEAAHDFTYDLAKLLRARPWFEEAPSVKIDPLGNIAGTLVSEGIATFMERYGTQNQTIIPPPVFPFTDVKFPELLGDAGYMFMYDAGLHLVEPILKKDFHAGMRELVRTPLTTRDLHDLPGYRQKILDKMAASNQ